MFGRVRSSSKRHALWFATTSYVLLVICQLSNVANTIADRDISQVCERGELLEEVNKIVLVALEVKSKGTVEATLS